MIDLRKPLKTKRKEREMKRMIVLLTLLMVSFIPQLSKDAKSVEEACLKLAWLNARAAAEEKEIEKAVKKVKKLHGVKIRQVAKKHQFDPRIITAVVAVESGGNPYAKSIKGARGLMQIKSIAAREANIENVYDEHQNLAGGTKYLKRLRKHYGFVSLEKILLAYNRGPDEAKRLIASGYNPSSDSYVQKVKTAFFYAAKQN